MSTPESTGIVRVRVRRVRVRVRRVRVRVRV